MPLYTVGVNTASATCTAAGTYVTTDTTSANTIVFTWPTYIWDASGATVNVRFDPTCRQTAEWVNANALQARSRRLREQRRATEEYMRQMGEAQEAERAQRIQAEARAEKLLREGLSPVQLQELADKGYFQLETVAPTGERRLYRINRGRVRNVQQIGPNGRVLRTLCAHPEMDLPDADTMLAQKLWLETNEAEFLRVANHS